MLGISPDSAESHQKFIADHGLKVTLLCDPQHNVIGEFGAWQLKDVNEGKWGVVRSTFIVDPAGKIAHIWRNVKASGHVDEVKRRLSELQSSRRPANSG